MSAMPSQAARVVAKVCAEGGGEGSGEGGGMTIEDDGTGGEGGSWGGGGGGVESGVVVVGVETIGSHGRERAGGRIVPGGGGPDTVSTHH